jgi:hypothetical protein
MLSLQGACALFLAALGERVIGEERGRGLSTCSHQLIGVPSLAPRVRGLRLDPQMLGIFRQPAPD